MDAALESGQVAAAEGIADVAVRDTRVSDLEMPNAASPVAETQSIRSERRSSKTRECTSSIESALPVKGT